MSEDRVNILVCDDSAIWRKIILNALASEPRFNVVEQASNGQEALARLKLQKIDIAIMDVEMPVMDGVETVREIRNRGFEFPIIMFSSSTTYGSEPTLDSLEAGANDYATKPPTVGDVNSAIDRVRHELCSRIIALANLGVRSSTGKTGAGFPGSMTTFRRRKICAVGIGSSTGGPAALAEVLASLPAPLSVPVLITQHMPASFIESLAERLSRVTEHEVHPAEEGEEVSAGKVLLAPGDHHMAIMQKRGQLRVALDRGAPVNSCRPAVDRMFESMAKNFEAGCLGVVLTGMGKDGLKGAHAIKSKGGMVIAQDEASSVVYGMPREVVDARLADKVLSIEEVGSGIMEVLGFKRKLLGT